MSEDWITPALKEDIEAGTSFEQSDWLGDWWYPGGNPELTWSELINWSIKILSADATRDLHPDYFIGEAPTYSISVGVDLPVSYVSGAKRVNAARGEWHDFSSVMGQNALFIPNVEQRMRDIMAESPKDSGERFRMHGKDESCMVEGTWFDWVCFARNVLASENTRLCCPDLYRPEWANDNY